MNGRTMTLLQTNAAINEGNSGGPLINQYGQVVGITNMKMGSYYSRVAVEGLGFAIPSTVCKTVVDQLLANGEVVGRPVRGITVGAISSADAARYQVPEGLYITAVSEGSDAAAQGVARATCFCRSTGRTPQQRRTSSPSATPAASATADAHAQARRRRARRTIKLCDLNDVY
jgi:serine protease Do